MYLEIITPEAQLYKGEISSIKLPGSKGSFQVLNNHAPLVSSLTKGLIEIKSQDGDKTFEVESGFVEVLKNKIIVLI